LTRRKYFFFEKKKIMLSLAALKKKREVRRQPQWNKSFLVLFFKKELLPSPSLLFALILGGITALALPPFTFIPALFVGIPGLVWLIGNAATARSAALRGFAWGVGHHLVGLYWVTNAILVQAAQFWWAVPIAVPLLAAVLAVFIAVPCALARLVPAGWARVSMLAGAWELGDIARQFVLSGFPWNPLGSVWEMPGALGLIFMQPAAWVGVGGLTLFTLLIAGAFAVSGRATLAALAALAVWAAAGAARLNAPAGPVPGLTAVLVQGNVSELEHRDHYEDRVWMEQIFERHLVLTRQGVAEAQATKPAANRVLVVWPETASPYWLAEDRGARRAIAEAASPAVATIAGTIRADGPTAIHNSLVAVMPDGSVAGFYDKHHLVPYGEYFPSYLPIRLGEQGFAPGPGPRTLHIPGLPPIGPLICFEAVFPGDVIDEHNRPAFMLNITNDSWFGNSTGPRQHFAAARMRAVEEGMPLVRAANTGISAVIDSHGRVAASLGLGQRGVLVAAIPGYMQPTLFSRWGLLIPAIFATLGCFMSGLLGRMRGKAGRMDKVGPKNAISGQKS
jgi:apolipoprotein N-acyltransferase